MYNNLNAMWKLEKKKKHEMTLCSKTFQSQIMSNLYQTRFNTIGMIGGFDQYFKNKCICDLVK